MIFILLINRDEQGKQQLPLAFSFSFLISKNKFTYYLLIFFIHLDIRVIMQSFGFFFLICQLIIGLGKINKVPHPHVSHNKSRNEKLINEVPDVLRIPP